MHPILAHRERLALYLVAWVPVAALLAGLLFFSGGFSWSAALIVAAPMMLVYSFLCLSGWYLCRTFPVERTGFAGLLGIYAIAAGLSSTLWILLGRGWVLALAAAADFAMLDERYTSQIPMLFGVGILLFLLAAALHYLMTSFENAAAAERRALELQILAGEAELRALRAQIDPHFLYNSLNSISALTAIEPAGARTMCNLLADFLRKSLELGAREFISLDEELSLASSFLGIEKVRLGERLRVQRQIEPASLGCLVPSLLLQPLIENSLRHGISQLIEGGEIRIESRKRGGRLSIRIENPCDGERPPARGEGIGLMNVRTRIRTLYDREAGLDLEQGPGRFQVTLTLPAMEGKEAPE